MGAPRKRTVSTCHICELALEHLVVRSGRSDRIDIKVAIDGRRWWRGACPDCKGGYKAEVALEARDAENEGPDTPLYPPKVRSCRGCGVNITKQYFSCTECSNRDYGFNEECEYV